MGRPRRRPATRGPRGSAGVAGPVAAVLLAACAPVPAAPVPAAAGSTAGLEALAARAVGPLFPAGLDQPHTCTAVVLDTPRGDLALTAAHCVAGSGGDALLVPGYAGGAAPAGAWRVVRAWADPAWTTGQDPAADAAVLQVVPASGQAAPVQALAGGARLAAAPAAGSTVLLRGYRRGLDDEALRCAAPVALDAGAPVVACAGWTGGTSGSPLLQAGADGAAVVTGVIGGPHQGGCDADASTSAPFGAPVLALLARAEASEASEAAEVADESGDVLPVPGDDGC